VPLHELCGCGAWQTRTSYPASGCDLLGVPGSIPAFFQDKNWAKGQHCVSDSMTFL